MPKQKKEPDFTKYAGSYIIPIMGPTGSGKSSFINDLFGGEEVAKVGHTLESCTSALEPIEVPATVLQQKRLKSRNPDKKLIIVDTPGFDDTNVDDSTILKRIADWLAQSYGAGAQLSGIIYLHDISAPRMTGATKKNLDVFEKMCGIGGCWSVVLGTTKWRKMSDPEDYMKAEVNEKLLRERYWEGMIGRGSTAARVENRESPWNLVDIVLSRSEKSDILQIQNEMVRLQMSIPQTEAAGVLRKRIQEQIDALKEAGATRAVVRAFVKQVEVLKGKSGFERFWNRFSFRLFG